MKQKTMGSSEAAEQTVALTGMRRYPALSTAVRLEASSVEEPSAPVADRNRDRSSNSRWRSRDSEIPVATITISKGTLVRKMPHLHLDRKKGMKKYRN